MVTILSFSHCNMLNLKLITRVLKFLLGLLGYTPRLSPATHTNTRCTVNLGYVQGIRVHATGGTLSSSWGRVEASQPSLLSCSSVLVLSGDQSCERLRALRGLS